jgi:DNA-binding winged helix-turn-helix (wHTH) protein
MSDGTSQRAASENHRDSPPAARETCRQETPRVYEFGPFRLDPTERKLLRGNEIVALTPKAFDTLVLLVRHSGHLLEKDELIRMLWPDSFVEEGSLSNNVFLLRKALGEEPAYIETVPRRGYRFVGAVRRFPDGESERREEPRQDRSEDAIRAGCAATVSPEVQAPPFRVWKRWSARIAISAVFVIVVGVGFWVATQRHARSDISSRLKIFPLTGSIDGEADPAFSPDGKQVAYVGQDERRRNFNVYVKLIGAGRPLRLTSNAEEERFPAWSPDGRYIAFLRETEHGDDVYVIPALGGPERRLTQAAFYHSSLSWSPDGKLLAIADKASSTEPITICLVSLEDGTKRKSYIAPGRLDGGY